MVLGLGLESYLVAPRCTPRCTPGRLRRVPIIPLVGQMRMRLEEYRDARTKLIQEHKEAQLALAQKYADQFKGDIQLGHYITDHIGTIRVDSISFSSIELNPEPLYRGLQFTKEGQPFKTGTIRSIPHSNLRKVYKEGPPIT